MGVLRRVSRVLTGMITVMLACIAGLLTIPHFIGYQSLAVLSGSMEPVIPVGSIVYTKETAIQDLKEGDIITYDVGNNMLVTHRIQSIDEKKELIYTKGDANRVEDVSPVSYEQIRGRADYHVPVLGYITVFIQENCRRIV